MNRLKQFLIILVALLLGNLSLMAQEISVTGKVTDAADGTPMIGVAIVVKGTTTGTITNVDGEFSIKCKGNDVLVFSFVGYNTQEVAVGSRSVINVQMKQESKEIDEVIVIGYGVQKKSDRTGSVVNVKAEELNRGSLTDPIQAMQGKVAGVNVSKKGGDPNSGFAVQIRGA
ncbi:MAG TPA: carboxypeptidase-like regulatory domain-containing protein, partial [Tenuifilum sp.]|nr:carboxypeptidase-like regulatory domain-containing protein [Tenuifilum sp.]HOK86366.1 carboxypeptidase-like regulatory domain-containing protein [Tenuifilum sp.]